MPEKLRLGLVGCGDFGATLGKIAQEFADVTAVCDVKAERGAKAAATLGNDICVFSDAETMFDRAGLDGIIVTAANFAHCDLTVAAAQAGLHVFCEKAMARTVPECWQMVRACRDHNVKLMIGHKRRLRPPWARMIELTHDDLLGQLMSITVSEYCDYREFNFQETWWGDPKLGGGFFHMHGVHVIDWFRALAGDVKRVWAMSGPQHDRRWKFPDIYHANFQFQSGALASISGGLGFPLHRFRQSQIPVAECRHGGFKMMPEQDHIDLHWQRYDDPTPRHERFDDLGHATAFRTELRDFVAWVERDREPCLGWVEGLRCVEMMEAAYRSAAAGGECVVLPLYPELEDAELTEVETQRGASGD